MVGILFAAFSMAATVVATFIHKADLERPISHKSTEGVMMIMVCDRIFIFIFWEERGVTSKILINFFAFDNRGELSFYLCHSSL